MVYFIIILILFYLIYNYDYKNKVRFRKDWLIFITVYLIIIGGLHYRVGYDTQIYESYFNKLVPITKLKYSELLDSRFAPGFIILASTTKLFCKDMLLFNFIQSTFVIGVVVNFFNKYCKHVFFAILLFCIFMYTLLIFEQIREAISVAIFLLAWPFFVKRNWLIWCLLSLCAMTFHTSATMMLVLPVITLPFIKNLFIFGKKTIVICIVILIVAYAINSVFFKYVQFLSVTEATQELTNKYEDTKYIKGSLNISGIIMGIFKNILYPYIALLFFNHKNREVKHTFKEIEAFTLLSIYISIFSFSIPIISRFNNYFLFFPIILMSDWIFEYIPLGKKKLKISCVSWIIFFLPLIGVQLYASYFAKHDKTKYRNYQIYYPYTSYIDKQKLEDREKMYIYAKKNL